MELVFPKGNQIFLLNGKTLQLLQPLDRDKENLSHIVFQVMRKRRTETIIFFSLTLTPKLIKANSYANILLLISKFYVANKLKYHEGRPTLLCAITESDAKHLHALCY